MNSLFLMIEKLRLTFGLAVFMALAVLPDFAAAAIAYRAATQAGVASGNLTITKPAGTVSGDVMVATIAVRPQGTTITAPAGWTAIATTQNANDVTMRMATYWKAAGGSEPASYTWTFGGTAHTGVVGGIISFSGVDTAAPINVWSVNAMTTAGYAVQANGVTTTVAGAMLVTSHSFTSSTSNWTVPGGMTEVVDAASGVRPDVAGMSMEMNYESRPTAGVTGSRTATANSTGTDAGYGIGHAVALKPGLPALSVADATWAETNVNAGRTFTATLNTTTTAAVTATYSFTSGTATGGAACSAGIDFINAGGTLTIAAGATSTTIPVTVCGDTLFEADETLTVTLSAPANATLGTATALGTISNDDTAPTLNISNATVAEGNSGTTNLNFTVALSAASGLAASASFATSAGTATAGASCAAGVDYISNSGTVSIPIGSTTGTVTVQVCSDTMFEADETLTVTLSAPANATLGTATALGTIINDDTLLPVAEYRMDEISWNGTAGEVGDSSGNALHGRALLGAMPAAAKICNGANLSANYVEVPDNALLSIPNTLTVTAWIKPARWGGTSGKDALMSFYSKDTNYEAHVTNTGQINWWWGTGNITSVATAPVGAWTHVAMVYTSGSQTLYVNGVSSATGSVAGVLPVNTLPFQIGDDQGFGGGTRRFDGQIDELKIFNIAMTPAQVTALYNNENAGKNWDGTTRTCPSAGLHHIQIEHAGSGATCSPTTLTIKACTDAACSSLYTAGVVGTLTASGTPTVNWVGGANFSIGLTGYVTKDVQVTTAGTVNWGTSTLAPVATSGTSCYVGASASCSFTSALAGFIFDVPHHASNTPQTISLSAVRQSDNSLACTPAFASTSKTVNFGCSYGNPTTGTLPVVVGGSNIACGSSTGVSLAFNAGGVATTTVRYADVGQMSLTANYTGSGGSETGLVMTGTDTFVAAPASFGVAATGPIPYVAGVNFGATVTALNASGTATPNFGKETVPASATLGFTRCQPTGAGTSAGVFTGGTLGAFSGGAANASNLNWSEVGNGDVTAVLTGGNYLGSGLTATGNSGTGGTVCNTAGNVGPFRPHHFDTALTHGCTAGAFTYSGQPFAVTVTAKSGLATPTTTVNYSGTTTPAFAKAVTLSDANGAAGAWANNSIAAGAFSGGVANAAPAFSFTAQPGGPAVLKPRATDTDTVSSSLGTEATTPLRFGRVRIANAFGPASGSLAMPVQAQYWSGSSWVLNSGDSCTTLPASAFFLSGALAATTAASAVTLASGVGSLVLTKSTSATGSLDVAANLGAAGSDQSCLATHGGTASSRPWLRSRNGSCAATYDRDPSARATFGIYSPETRRTVHVRELF